MIMKAVKIIKIKLIPGVFYPNSSSEKIIYIYIYIYIYIKGECICLLFVIPF